MQTERELYLADKPVAEFLRYFVDVVTGKRQLNHRYTVKPRAWLASLDRRKKGKTLLLPSFQDAFNEYFWMTPDAESSDSDDSGEGLTLSGRGTTYKQNEKVLLALTSDFKKAIENDDKERVFLLCVKILDWGQVYRGAVGWLVEQYEKDCLVQKISQGKAILDGDSLAKVSAFDDALRMDSGLTKIYSLASDKSVIYDDRVGAALGLLVRIFLEQEGKPLCLDAEESKNVRGGVVPDNLRFMRSGRRDRNPTVGPLKFPPRGTRASFQHARSNLMANWVLSEVVNRVSDDWNIRMLEATLFMIGYKVAEQMPQVR